ncbi:MAG: hypothetical protein FD139_2651 [Methylocystaceae bacterium]|nr:MAG: hypothetical protein FD172_2679 [Methylocystaceae bacterium]TXT43818.1 MAG: hypothetical protein FD139_2651 [Methylocystaceae bacterium]
MLGFSFSRDRRRGLRSFSWASILGRACESFCELKANACNHKCSRLRQRPRQILPEPRPYAGFVKWGRQRISICASYGLRTAILWLAKPPWRLGNRAVGARAELACTVWSSRATKIEPQETRPNRFTARRNPVRLQVIAALYHLFSRHIRRACLFVRVSDCALIGCTFPLGDRVSHWILNLDHFHRFSSSAAEIASPIASAARRTGSASRCA